VFHEKIYVVKVVGILLTWGRIALRSKKSSATMTNNGVFMALKVKLSSFGLCCFVLGKFHGYMVPPSSMLIPHTFQFIVCLSPHILTMECELLSVWRAGLGCCQTSEESRFDSRQGKGSKVPRRAVGPTQHPANNWELFTRGLNQPSPLPPHLVRSVRMGGAYFSPPFVPSWHA
jgi:hypothetical protein